MWSLYLYYWWLLFKNLIVLIFFASTNSQPYNIVVIFKSESIVMGFFCPYCQALCTALPWNTQIWFLVHISSPPLWFYVPMKTIFTVAKAIYSCITRISYSWLNKLSVRRKEMIISCLSEHNGSSYSGFQVTEKSRALNFSDCSLFRHTLAPTQLLGISHAFSHILWTSWKLSDSVCWAKRCDVAEAFRKTQ